MPSRKIGTLAESSLHASLKQWLFEPGDFLEQEVDGWVVDIVRGDLLIEVQTGAFSTVRRKLERLLESHRVLLAYPVTLQKQIITVDKDTGEVISSRRSPRRGRITDLFQQLVSIPHLIGHPGFEIAALLVKVEEERCRDGKGSWRRRGVSILDRRLVEVCATVPLASPDAFAALVADLPPEGFTAADLAASLGITQRLAQRAAYCLSKMGTVEVGGKRGRAYLYRRLHL